MQVLLHVMLVFTFTEGSFILNSGSLTLLMQVLFIVFQIISLLIIILVVTRVVLPFSINSFVLYIESFTINANYLVLWRLI